MAQMAQFVIKRYFEDIAIGDKAISMGRTVTEADIVNFAGISGDYNTLHTDKEYAKESIAGERLAHGFLSLIISSGLYTRTYYNLSTLETLTAFTEIRSWRFRRPVLIGDTIHVEAVVTEKIDTKPEASNGKVVFHRAIVNQKGEIVQDGDCVFLIKKRPNKS